MTDVNPTTTEPTVEPTVEPTTTTTTTTTTAAAAATDVEAPKTTETEQQVEEEQPKDEQVPTEEASPAPKTTLTKRRTIFNPFGKPKKEDQVESDESAENKKKTKGFGAFFSKSKVTPPHKKKSYPVTDIALDCRSQVGWTCFNRIRTRIDRTASDRTTSADRNRSCHGSQGRGQGSPQGRTKGRA